MHNSDGMQHTPQEMLHCEFFQAGFWDGMFKKPFRNSYDSDPDYSRLNYEYGRQFAALHHHTDLFEKGRPTIKALRLLTEDIILNHYPQTKVTIGVLPRKSAYDY